MIHGCELTCWTWIDVICWIWSLEVLGLPYWIWIEFIIYWTWTWNTLGLPYWTWIDFIKHWARIS